MGILLHAHVGMQRHLTNPTQSQIILTEHHTFPADAPCSSETIPVYATIGRKFEQEKPRGRVVDGALG